MHIAFDGGNHDPSVGARNAFLALLYVRNQVGDCTLHHPGALHDLWQEHLPGAEQVADHIHPIHQRTFDDLQRALESQTRLFRVLDHEVVYAFDQRVLESLRDRQRAPLEVGLSLAPGAFTLEPGGHLQQPLGSVRTPIQHDVLDDLPQIGRDSFVDRELAGIHDPHVHAGGNRVVEKHGMHHLADGVVAAEGE